MTYKTFVVLLLLLTGCARPTSVAEGVRETIVLPAPTHLSPAVRLKIVRCTPNFLSRRVTDKLIRARDIFASYGVGMEVTSVVELENPDWKAVDEKDHLSFDLFVRGTPEHVVFLVETIELRGQQAGGLGNTKWCAVVQASWDQVVAHEVLHGALRAANIDQQDDRQGHRNTPLNLMADRDVTYDHVRLDKDQQDALRNWAKLRWGK